MNKKGSKVVIGMGILLIGVMIILVIEVIDRGGEEGRNLKKIGKRGILSTLMFSYSTIIGLKGELKGIVKGIHPKAKEILNRSILKGSYEFEEIEEGILKGSGDLFSLNEEAVLKLNPGIILGWNNFGINKKDLFEKLGIKVEIFNYSEKESEVKKWLRKIAQIVGEEAKYNNYERYREEIKREIRERIKGRGVVLIRGLYFYNYKELKVCGRNSYQQTHFDLLGMENGVNRIFKGENGLPKINIEMIIKMDPEVILIRPLDEIKLEEIIEDKRLQGVRAIKEKRVYRVPLGGYDWSAPGLENPLFWIWLGKLIYPDEMEGIDIREEIKEKIKWLYNKVNMDEEMISKILNEDENGKMRNYYHMIYKGEELKKIREVMREKERLEREIKELECRVKKGIDINPAEGQRDQIKQEIKKTG